MDIDAARRAAKELQLLGGAETVSFHGRSMEPFLLDGDDLKLEPVEWSDIAVGDVITYRFEERFPTLRVVRKSATKLVLRGDNWTFADFDVWPEDVLGRVTTRLRHGEALDVRSLAWRVRKGVSIADDRLRRLKRRAVCNVSRVRKGVKRRVKGVQSSLGDLPSGIQVNVSATCNLGCRMCPYLSVHDNPDYVREMSEETFRQLLPTLAHVPVLDVVGSGEPLFNRRVPEFIRLAREVNPSIRIALTTNATLLTERMCRDLIAAGLDMVVVSLDGATAKTVESIRIGINFEKVLANIRTLARVKAELGVTKPLVRANYVVGYGSYAELPDFVSMMPSLGIQSMHVLEILDGTEVAWRDNLANSVQRDHGRTLREAKRRADAAGITMIMPTVIEDVCFQPYQPHVSESGAVSPCCFVDYDTRAFWQDGKAVSMPKIEYGNVNDTPFAEIWKTPAFAELRARDRRGDFPDYCQTCANVRSCTSKAVRAAID